MRNRGRESGGGGWGVKIKNGGCTTIIIISIVNTNVVVLCWTQTTFAFSIGDHYNICFISYYS